MKNRYRIHAPRPQGRLERIKLDKYVVSIEREQYEKVLCDVLAVFGWRMAPCIDGLEGVTDDLPEFKGPSEEMLRLAEEYAQYPELHGDGLEDIRRKYYDAVARYHYKNPELRPFPDTIYEVHRLIYRAVLKYAKTKGNWR